MRRKQLYRAVIILLTVLCIGGAAAAEEGKNPLGALLDGLSRVRDTVSQIRNEMEEIKKTGTGAFAIRKWQEIYENPDYRIYTDGEDDPAELPISGRHAFVILGYELQNGEMTDELKARCDAAAHAAKVFPDSCLVCSGGATGTNNPEGHTEAGLMRDYLTGSCGIDGGRILTDERAMTTLDNAVNTFAILKELGTEEITVVTSSYHQKRANLLYVTMAEIVRQKDGIQIGIAGNYSCGIETPEGYEEYDALIAVMQLNELLRMQAADNES